MVKSIDDLPNEMLLQIFSYCHVEDLVLHVQYVSHHWYELVQDTEMWKHLSYFPGRGISTEDVIEVLKNAPLLKALVLLENVEKLLVDALCRYCPNIERLEFYDTQTVSTEMLENILKFLTKLRNLTLRSMDIDSQNFASVLGNFNNLKKLSLLHTFYTGSDILQSVADGCNALEYLRLDGMDVSDRNIQYFIAKKGPQLSGLLVDGFRSSAASLMEISRCTNLQSFMFHDCTALRESVFVDITRLPKLKSLQLLSAQNISADLLARSLCLRSLNQLVELDLTKSQMDDDGAKSLSVNCKNLRLLTLAMCFHLTDHGMYYIARLVKLQHLNVKNCCLTDGGMAFLPQLRWLMYLNISRNSVGDEGMYYIMKCSQLSVLQANYCHISTDAISKVTANLKLLVRFSYIGCESCSDKKKHSNAVEGHIPCHNLKA